MSDWIQFVVSLGPAFHSTLGALTRLGWWSRGPRLRVWLRGHTFESSTSTEPGIRFEASNQGLFPTALYPAVVVKGYSIPLPNPRGTTRFRLDYDLEGEGEQLKLEAISGAKTFFARPRRPEVGDPTSVFRNLIFKEDTVRFRGAARVRVVGLNLNGVNAAKYFVLLALFRLTGWWPHESKTIDDYTADRRARG